MSADEETLHDAVSKYRVDHPEKSPGGLTPTELSILRHLLRGMHVTEIAPYVQRSYRTVKTHTYNIREKAGVRTMLQLGAWAERHGIRESA